VVASLLQYHTLFQIPTLPDVSSLFFVLQDKKWQTSHSKGRLETGSVKDTPMIRFDISFFPAKKISSYFIFASAKVFQFVLF
jgi:hypothetical protein